MRIHQLSVILVRGYHVNGGVLIPFPFGDGSDDVIRLESLHHENRDPEGAHEFRKRLQGVDHKLRCGASCRLVFRVHLVSESASRRVESHGEMRRLLP